MSSRSIRPSASSGGGGEPMSRPPGSTSGSWPCPRATRVVVTESVPVVPAGEPVRALRAGGGLSDQIGAVFAALSDPTRRTVVQSLLRDGSTSVPALTATPADQPPGRRQAPGGPRGGDAARAYSPDRARGSLPPSRRGAGTRDCLAEGRRIGLGGPPGKAQAGRRERARSVDLRAPAAACATGHVIE